MTLHKTVLAGAFVLLVSLPAQAATYYVRTDGNNGNSGLTNTSGGAWRNIDYAADRVAPGDVVRVQAGTYSERVTPGVNGASVTSTVTFVADGAVTVCGWDFFNNSYIRVIGFVIKTNGGTCTMTTGCVEIDGTNGFLEFWNNVFRDATYNGIRGNGLSDRINNSIVVGNTFSNFGIGNGSGIAVALRGSNNFVAYNEVFNVHPDAFLLDGTDNRWVNNYVHDLSEVSGGHSDVFQAGSSTLGLSYNLVEANFQVAMGDLGDEHTAQISHGQPTVCSGTCGAMTENVFRRNVFHNVSSYTVGINQTTAGSVSYTRFYNNTTAGAVRNQPTTRYGIQWYGTGTSNGYIHNNIEYQSWGDSVSSSILVFYVTGGLVADYNLAYSPLGSVTFTSPWTSQANPRSNVNPVFVDTANDDFTLGASSGAIGRAGNLTTVVGSGSGQTFTLASRGGGFFRGRNSNLAQYAGNLAGGDVITVGNDVLRVSTVSGDTVTVTSPFTWASGDPVYFGDTSTPDIGAFPYRTEGYSFSVSYSVSQGTAVVIPSKPELVRFVVCYDDGVPTAVDSTSPYSCSVGGGAFSVRAYPAFASKRLFVGATSGPPAPSSVLIKK